MTHTDYTKLILNIKDNNIYFDENCLKNKNIKGKETKVFHGHLTYNPEICPKCGAINEGYNDIIKWNWKRNCKIKLPKISGYNCLLALFYTSIDILFNALSIASCFTSSIAFCIAISISLE